MARKRVKKIFTGIVLLFLASLIGTLVYYQSVEKPSPAALPQTALSPSPAVSPTTQPVNNPGTFSEEMISLNALIEEADDLYSDEEKSRQEGFLWIDRKASKYIVTLGALNGVRSDGALAVFDGSREIGVLNVERVFDVISYVDPGELRNKLTQDYYQVRIK